MFFHPKNLKSENNNPWLKPWFNILLHTQATVDSQCLEYLGYITLLLGQLDFSCSLLLVCDFIHIIPAYYILFEAVLTQHQQKVCCCSGLDGFQLDNMTEERQEKLLNTSEIGSHKPNVCYGS